MHKIYSSKKGTAKQAYLRAYDGSLRANQSCKSWVQCLPASSIIVATPCGSSKMLPLPQSVDQYIPFQRNYLEFWQNIHRLQEGSSSNKQACMYVAVGFTIHMIHTCVPTQASVWMDNQLHNWKRHRFNAVFLMNWTTMHTCACMLGFIVGYYKKYAHGYQLEHLHMHSARGQGSLPQ